MSKMIEIVAKAGDITFENIYKPEEVKDHALDILQTVKDDQVWNTGCAMIGDPHIDEYVNINKTLLTDPNAWKSQGIAAIRLYRSNAYAHLLPGDKLTLTTRSGEESLYYLMMNDEFLKVTMDGAITEGEDREEGFVPEDYLDRTTGIGSEEEINFDSAEMTEKMNQAVEIEESTEEETDPENP